MSYPPYHPGTNPEAAVRDAGAHGLDGGDGSVRARLMPRQGAAGALQEVAAGLRCGAAPWQLMESIDAASRQVGNRAFMHWVGALHAAGQVRESHINTVPGRWAPARPWAGAAPLQFGPKKQRKKKEPAAQAAPGPLSGAVPQTGAADETGAKSETPSESGATAGPEAQATAAQDKAGEAGVSGEKKKKKKSRVQVALNTLREEGVEAFRSYIEARIGETELLHTLTERITRAQDLGGVSDAALGVVRTRLRVLDPMAVAEVPREHGGVTEKPSVASEKAVLTLREAGLVDTCMKGNTSMFRQLLRFGAVDVNLATEHGTLLHIAAHYDHTDIVRELLSRRGINVNLARRGGVTPLLGAAMEGRLEVVKLLLDARGINPNLGTLGDGVAPITIAAFQGYKDVIELLLTAGNIDIDVRQRDGTTALFAAVQGDHPEVVELLIRRGANVNLGMLDGITPLMHAAYAGHIEVAKHLLQAPDIRVNQRTTVQGKTSLIVAAFQGHKEIVRLLVAAGNVDINMRQKDGATALYAASQYNYPDIVEMLIRAGADVNLPLKNNITPLCAAAHEGSIKVVKHLLQAPGIQVDTTARQKISALGYACRNGHKEVAELLLIGKADPNIVNDLGLAALHAACITGFTDIVELLLANKADPNITDVSGLAPLHLACLLGDAEIVEMLLNAGADTDLVAENEYTPYQAACTGGHQAIISLMEARGQQPAGQAPHPEGKSQKELPEQTAPTTASPASAPQTGDLPAGPGSQAPVTETQSPLGQAKQELRQDIFMRLRNDRLDTGDGFKLLEAVNMVADLDGLCGIYIRMAKIERKKVRTGGIPFRCEFAAAREEAEPHTIPGFVLGDKSGLDAEAVEDEIKKHLAQTNHRFVSQGGE